MQFAAIYARYSSDKQTEDSIDAQVRACREYAAAHGLEVVEVYADEAVSGKGSKTAQRRQYARLLKDAQRGRFSVILIHKYDRIARNLGEHVNLASRLQAWGVELVATAQNFGHGPEGKIMRALVWSMSEYYIDNLAEETRKGLKETALQALHTGGVPPFGYDIVDQHYQINPLEAGFVRRIFDTAQKGEGFSTVLKEISAAGLTGKRGRPIKYPQVYEMLRNEKYTGTYLYTPTQQAKREARREKAEAIRIEGAIPAIITKEQFLEVQKIMRARKHVGRHADYLCSGLVYCSCGAKMHGATSRRKGHEYRWFRCSAHCGAPSVRMDDVEDAARRYLRGLLTEETQREVVAALQLYRAGQKDRAADFRRTLAAKIRDKRAQYDALVANMSSGVLPPDVLADLGLKLQQVKEDIATLEQVKPPKDITHQVIRSWLQQLSTHPDQAAMRLLIERVDVLPHEQKERTVFNIQSTLKTVLRINGCGGQI